MGYAPSELQEGAHKLLDPGLRLPQVGLVLGGERAGKSTVAGYEAAALALWGELVFVAGAEYENTEPEFEYMMRGLEAIGAVQSVRTPRRNQWEAVLHTGCEIRTVSFRQRGEDALIATGKAPDVVVLSEAGLLDFRHFRAAFTRCAEKRGAVVAAGTLKGAKPWYAEKYREFQGDNPYHGRAVSLPSWANVTVYPGGREDPTIKAVEAALDEQLFAERIGAEPVPSSLLVFGRQFRHEMHVENQEYDPELEVEVAVDPGYAGGYAVEVVQWTGPADVRVIDEFYAQYATWHEAVDWVRRLPYGERIKRGVGDIAIRQHHGDRSQYENWRDAGILLQSAPVSIEAGISRMRDFLVSPFTGTPRIKYDPRCEGAIFEFGREMYHGDEDGNPLKDQPVDRFNHARKAMSYWLVHKFGLSDTERRAPEREGDPWGLARRRGRRGEERYMGQGPAKGEPEVEG